MKNQHYDVIIVGGGTGGLNLAALLSNVGKKVLLLERNREEALGGRAASATLNGSSIDNGIKGLILAGTQDEVFRRIGKKIPENVCEWTNSGEIYKDGEWNMLDDMIQESLEEFMRVYKRTAVDLSYEQLEQLEDISIEKFVADNTNDQNVIDFFRYLGWLFGGTLPVPYDYSAGSLFYSIKKQVDTNGFMPSQSYWVKGGTGAIAKALVESIKENGGEIRTNTPVFRIVIENGRAIGVEIEEGPRVLPTQLRDLTLIEAPVVVSAVAIWDIFNILSKDDLSPWYAERLEYLHRRTLNLATLTYELDREGIWDHSGQRWAQKGPVSGKPWCASSLRLSEDENRYQISFWMQLGWWEKPNYFLMHDASHKAALKKLFEDWEGDVKTLFPKVAENALWKIRAFGPATIMEAPGNVGKKLVDIEAEGIEGLYLVGERTSEAKIMGVYGSAQTALKAFDLIVDKYPVK